MLTPRAFVGIALKCPPGFRSNESRWLAPPFIHKRTHCVGFFAGAANALGDATSDRRVDIKVKAPRFSRFLRVVFMVDSAAE
jgi:hypothetical protein